jgi:hypothetical protein
MLKPEQVQAACKTAHLFFDADLNPVTPQVGEWYCEVDWDTDIDGDDFVTEGALVRYEGTSISTLTDGTSQARHRVTPDGDDEDRTPQGMVLVRQS